MAKDDLVKCPLCDGHAQISRSEVIDLLADPILQEKAKKYLAELRSAQETGVGAGSGRDFQKEVHRWNPQAPIWSRSPKE